MMGPLLKYLIFLLAVYGALTIILNILGAVHGRMAVEAAKVRMVIIVKNVEECIEYIIRNAVRYNLPARIMSKGSLTVIDMNSTDETPEILQKLKKDYECINVISAGDNENIFSDFLQNRSLKANG